MDKADLNCIKITVELLNANYRSFRFPSEGYYLDVIR